MLTVLSAASQNRQDTVYQINWDIDVPVLATSTGLNALAFIAIQNLNPRTPTVINNLQPGYLIELDKKSISNYSHFADNASDWVAGGSMLLPLTLIADKNLREEAMKLSILVSETALVTHGLTLTTKRLTMRNRPYVFNPNAPMGEKLKVESMLSFYSGHTAMTASMSFFTAKVWSDYYPYSKWKPVVWTAAAAVPAVAGYLRIKAGKHYFTDVATGYAVGALVGYFVPHFHKVDRKSKHRYRISSIISPDGIPLLTFKYRV